MYFVIFLIVLALLLDVSCCIISARKNKSQALVYVDDRERRKIK